MAMKTWLTTRTFKLFLLFSCSNNEVNPVFSVVKKLLVLIPSPNAQIQIWTKIQTIDLVFLEPRTPMKINTNTQNNDNKTTL